MASGRSGHASTTRPKSGGISERATHAQHGLFAKASFTCPALSPTCPSCLDRDSAGLPVWVRSVPDLSSACPPAISGSNPVARTSFLPLTWGPTQLVDAGYRRPRKGTGAALRAQTKPPACDLVLAIAPFKGRRLGGRYTSPRRPRACRVRCGHAAHVGLTCQRQSGRHTGRSCRADPGRRARACRRGQHHERGNGHALSPSVHRWHSACGFVNAPPRPESGTTSCRWRQRTRAARGPVGRSGGRSAASGSRSPAGRARTARARGSRPHRGGKT